MVGPSGPWIRHTIDIMALDDSSGKLKICESFKYLSTIQIEHAVNTYMIPGNEEHISYEVLDGQTVNMLKLDIQFTLKQC